MIIHLFVSSSMFFYQCVVLLEFRSFVSLGRFIHRHFIVFDAMVNRIVSLVSLSDLMSLVCRNATDFCVSILYPAILPISLMSSNSFLVVTLGFSVYSVMSRAKSDSFTSFPMIAFISFSSLIAVARASKTMLGRKKKWREWTSLSCS